VFVLAGLLFLTAPALAQEVVISQVYGGGGNAGAAYRNDYVQLFNRGATSVALSGWTVQYASATGTTWVTTPLSGSIAAHGYYLIGLFQGPGGTTDLPTPEAVGTIDLDASSGKVALVAAASSLSGACPTDNTIVDFVGYGGADCARGGSPAPMLDDTTAVLRLALGCTDADQNDYDFFTFSAFPFNSTGFPFNSTGLNRCTRGDTDFDNAKDPGVWRGSTGFWYIRQSSTGDPLWGPWGTPGDRPVPGDYDGDGFMDPAVWRPSNGTWLVLTSGSDYSSVISRAWGSQALGDVPVPADYDGDGRTDMAVWRPGNGGWYILTSVSRFNINTPFSVSWGRGANGDMPVPADYDGDLRADPAVWRAGAGTWFVLQSSTNYTTHIAHNWGKASLGDQPVQGDYDGDGMADLAVWRPGSGTWYVLTSTTGYTGSSSLAWGSAAHGDRPVPGDYDADGIIDFAVWRSGSGVWYIVMSSTGNAFYFTVTWGSGALGDVPLTIR
jgi:hypothetical protein